MENKNKRTKGQFFTVTNPFKLNAFFKWYNNIDGIDEEEIIEPYAGANNIVKMIEDIHVTQPKGWKCYDIQPPKYNNAPEYEVIQEDTIKNFPTGYRVAITNPPYLAKNSATRRGIEYPDTEYDDIYKEALHQMLENVGYVAAIIPESYINSGMFTERLDTIISLNVKMFDDTECPVCLALFNPSKVDKTDVYRMDLYLGTIKDLEKELSVFLDTGKNSGNRWKFNDPEGNIGVTLIDNTVRDSILFYKGEDIDSDKVKPTSRSFTRISGGTFKNEAEREDFIKSLNELVSTYRENTQDVFMTSFKGLRKDGKYRRRLDFTTVRKLMTKVYEDFDRGLD